MDTYATCHMHALSTLELRGGPEHAKAICCQQRSPTAFRNSFMLKKKNRKKISVERIDESFMKAKLL